MGPVIKKDMKFPELAILDWGIGGMGFYNLLMKDCPGYPVVYLSDSGSVPYGRQSGKNLAERLGRIVGFLESHGVDKLVIACNAMSTVLEKPDNKISGNLKITGVISHAARKVLAIPGSQTIWIIGGRRTILSGAYLKNLSASGHRIVQRIAQPLSALIEAGDTGSPLFHKAMGPIIKPLQRAGFIVLACTHYMAAMESFRKFCPSALLIDPAYETLCFVKANWNLQALNGPSLFLTTGNPAGTALSAQKTFGVDIGLVYKIPLNLKPHGPAIPEGL